LSRPNKNRYNQEVIEKLRVYQNSLELISQVYNLIKNNRNLASDWSLCDQIKRASISVATNISEGYLRTKKQYRNFLSIASGSANEVITLLQIITKIYGIKTESLQEKYKLLARQIGALSSKLKSF
jgi:four helix bundle protein